MRKCKKCGRDVPWRITVDGKVRHLIKRKYCLTCSPFGEHNTRRLERPVTGERRLTCARCDRDYMYDKRKGHTLSHCNTCRTLLRKFKLKCDAIAYKGGSCSRCGYAVCANSLCFHHRNSMDKSFNISGNTNRSWESIVEELDKCDLLCANCHGEVHDVNHLTMGP